MKKLQILPLVAGAALLAAATVSAQTRTQEVIYVDNPKFVAPLVERWIAEYAKANPHVQIKRAESSEKADLRFTALTSDDSEGSNNEVVVTYVARYALLPVTTKANPLIVTLSKNRLDKKKLRKLFFSDKDLASGEDNNKLNIANPVTIYSGNNAASAAPVYASYFGYSTANLRGKKVSGDDIFLLSAIKKDVAGVTFNNLTYLYDTETRRLKEGLAILPLDVKKEQREILYSNNIDQTIALLEEEKIDVIPVPYIGAVYNREAAKVAARDFARWVITDGQQYNHSYGFLNPDKRLLAQQYKN
jgi:ABC-type phosphate transport system substrate-binding protein